VSHTIHFAADAASPFDDDALVAAIVAEGSWAPPSETGSLTYRNPATGVNAILAEVPPDVQPPGVRPLGLALTVPYVRPRFFALEIMPFIASAAAATGALLLDPQDDETAARPPDVVRLIASWDRGNELAVTAARASGADMVRMDPDHAARWWRHQRAVPGLTLRFALDHYVPNVRIVRRDGEDRALRAMSWPDHVSALLPDCDIFVLLESGGTGKLSIQGVAPAAAVRARLGSLVTRVELGWPELDRVDLLAPTNQAEAGRRLAGLELEPFVGYEGLGSDDFVDVAP
jgi:hypothetical protein